MSFLQGKIAMAAGGMSERALSDLLRSLGCEVVDFDADKLADVDILVDDLGLNELASQGWSRAALEGANPALVHVSVTPFGSTGPKADWTGGELIASAASGVLNLTGVPGRAPVKEALDACTFHADMVAASGLMSALFARSRTGSGQHVDVSVQEVAFNRNINSILVWQFDKRKLSRVGAALNYGKATVRCIWPLKDGWCFHSLMTGRFGAPANQALTDWIDEVGLENPMREVDWLHYDRSSLPSDERQVWESAIEAFFMTLSKDDIRNEGLRRGINACIIAEPADVLMDEHLAQRQFWAEESGRRTPGRFVSLKSGPDTKSSRSIEPAARKGPLSGVRVLDFSWALVGSITTKTLGDLGADVVKVESPSRPCLSRVDAQVAASSRKSLDDKPWFAHLNTSKKSLSLDLKKPEAREVLDPLLEWADVVVENFSPGTMAKLKLDYETISKINLGIVMVSGSVYGQTGPLAQEWGVDGTGGALSGRTFMTGWPDTGPLVPGAVPYGDVIVPYVMASAAIAALNERQQTGRGVHIDASMYEICVQQMKRAILSAQSGKDMERMGNDDPEVAWQGVFPVLGDDRWLAVSCPSKSDKQRLHEVIGDYDVATWCRNKDGCEAELTLQGAGIAASLVQDIEDLIESDPQIEHRGALIDLEHAVLGKFGHAKTPISFSDTRFEPFRAPSMGEHSRDIAVDLAGLSDSRVDELEALGVFS